MLRIHLLQIYQHVHDLYTAFKTAVCYHIQPLSPTSWASTRGGRREATLLRDCDFEFFCQPVFSSADSEPTGHRSTLGPFDSTPQYGLLFAHRRQIVTWLYVRLASIIRCLITFAKLKLRSVEDTIRQPQRRQYVSRYRARQPVCTRLLHPTSLSDVPRWASRILGGLNIEDPSSDG